MRRTHLDNDMKLSVYKQMRDTADQEALDELRGERADRFGHPPGEVEALLDVQALKLACVAAGVEEISTIRGRIEARFSLSKTPKPGHIKRVLEASDVPLEFTATSGLTVCFESPRDRREALRVGRKVLKVFIRCANL